MLEINWCVLLIGVLIGASIGGTIAGFVCYRLGYKRVWDKAHEYEEMQLLSWNL